MDLHRKTNKFENFKHTKSHETEIEDCAEYANFCFGDMTIANIDTSQPAKRFAGLDVGGANLKFATSDGAVRQTPFQLWKNPDELSDRLLRLVESLEGGCSEFAVTMTGEIADCFSCKQAGVKHIVESVERAFPRSNVSYFQVGGKFVDAANAIRNWKLTSASNWFALSQYIAKRCAPSSCFVLDVGSTTIDLVPVSKGLVATTPITDFDRLTNAELLYTGAARTPVCAVSRSVRVNGQGARSTVDVPVAAELFATMLDVYVVLGDMQEDRRACETADGREQTRKNSLTRLARCFCSDVDELPERKLLDFARQIKNDQLQLIGQFVNRKIQIEYSMEQPCRFIVSGQGEFIARAVLNTLAIGPVDLLSDLIGRPASRCAPAYALANLLKDSLLGE